MNAENVYYTMRYGAVVIHRGSIEMALDEKNLRDSIGNVTRNRNEYASNEAWKNEMEIRINALQYGLKHGWTKS